MSGKPQWERLRGCYGGKEGTPQIASKEGDHCKTNVNASKNDFDSEDE
jgi:hypothetical protein